MGSVSPAGPVPSLVADLRSGAAALRAHPAALRVVGADVLCSFVYGTQTVLLLLVARRLGAGADGYGYLLAGFGFGGVVATMVADRAANSARPARTLAAALIAVAAPAALFAVAPALPAAVALAALGGAGAILVEVCAETTLQRSLPDEVFTAPTASPCRRPSPASSSARSSLRRWCPSSASTPH